MAKTSFVLKEPNATKKTSIVLIFRFDNLTVKISTKQTVEPKFWDKSKQRVRQSINVNHTEINFSLNEMESKILDLFHRVISEYQRKPEPLELKNLFQLEYFEFKPQFTKSKRKSLLEVFDEYSEKMKSENKIPSVGQYKTAKQNLIDYAAFKGCDMQFETLTNSFRNDFINFLRHNKKYSESTLHRRLTFIKTVLYYAIDCRYIEESTIKMNIDKFGVPDIQAEKIALSASELKEIENLDLSNNKRLDRVRDKFLIGCYTGLRFSDFIRLNKHHIVDDKYIEIRQEKTEAVVTQPFWNEVRLIFEKYEYDLPAGISEGKFNKYLKEVCWLCESLKKKQEMKVYEGGKEKNILIPRSELVTSHTARRTFVTLKSELGLQFEDIATATGHKDIKILMGYVKLNAKQKADRLALLNDKFTNKDGI